MTVMFQNRQKMGACFAPWAYWAPKSWRFTPLCGDSLRWKEIRSAAWRLALLLEDSFHCVETRSAALRLAPLPRDSLRCAKSRYAAQSLAPLQGYLLRCEESCLAARNLAPYPSLSINFFLQFFAKSQYFRGGGWHFRDGIVGMGVAS
jgi:hypothetical protein